MLDGPPRLAYVRDVSPVSVDLPGPRIPRIGQTVLGLFAPYWSRRRMRERYGPVFRTDDAVAGPLVHIADRALVKEMFTWKPPDYNVGEPREEIMEPVVGRTSILLLDGDPHLRMRRLMLPPFHGRAIARFAEEIAEITDREIDTWRPGQRIRTREVAQAITLEVIVRIVFGITDQQRVSELRDLLPEVSSANPLVMLLRRDLGPIRGWSRFLARRDRIDELLLAEIAQRRADESNDAQDILAVLLAARDEDGNPLSDRELRDELITMLAAGHETTATSIGWTFERLLRNPNALRRLTTEVRDDDGSTYLDAVIKETLRMRPVVPEVFRMTTASIELGRHHFGPRTQLCAAMYLVQTDPELYGPDPLAFRPERFLDGAQEPYAWVPFGGGVRRCLGAAFAELEMRVIIERIIARATLRAPSSRGELPRFSGITVMPSRGGLAVVDEVTARTPLAAHEQRPT